MGQAEKQITEIILSLGDKVITPLNETENDDGHFYWFMVMNEETGEKHRVDIKFAQVL